ncbi:FAD/NAD(P)-binding domain-containing protein [Sphingomonas antarctica]|uniref:NAD(P)/FAD-dependent oxidoreductase n=1 Tax=Sphingomonas antarctica TaxID=2040274 RepID=UPI0039E936E0
MIDCAIIGGGPAGLTAAIYLARFHLAVRLYDNGSSRTALIPRTHNHAGYPGGIKGTDLLDLMHKQAAEFGVDRTDATVTQIIPDGGFFRVLVEGSEVQARSILLATGVHNLPPNMDKAEHDAALARGLIRYCPICDGYEVTDKRVGVIGTGGHGMREALFLRGFTPHITLVAHTGVHDLDQIAREKIEAAGIEIVDGPAAPIHIIGNEIAVGTADGERRFASIYPALGSHIRSELAVAAGAEASADGCLVVDDHQMTSVPGLFAAGDVVKGLDQISHAMGEAGVAATKIRNLLDERQPIRR